MKSKRLSGRRRIHCFPWEWSDDCSTWLLRTGALFAILFAWLLLLICLCLPEQTSLPYSSKGTYTPSHLSISVWISSVDQVLEISLCELLLRTLVIVRAGIQTRSWLLALYGYSSTQLFQPGPELHCARSVVHILFRLKAPLDRPEPSLGKSQLLIVTL